MCPCGRMVSLGFTSERFQPGTHICYLYCDDDERRRVMSCFVRSGLEASEAVGYFADVMAPEMLEPELARLGIPLSPPQLKPSLAIDTYCVGGRFEPDTMLGNLREFYARAEGEGFAGARVTGEMTWALRGIPGSERLVEYESSLNELVKTVPATIICQYDTRRFDGATAFEVLAVHPMILLHGQVWRNRYYVPSAESRISVSGGDSP